MKKKVIWISIVVIAAVILSFPFFLQEQGYIKIDPPGVEIQLHSGLFSKIRISSGAEPVAVNARVYKPRHLSVTTKQNGSTWQLNSFGPWGTLAQIGVKDNATTVLKLGPPFKIKPSVNRRDSSVSIDFSIIGQAGEHYSASVIKNGQQLPTPKLKIVDEAGKILVEGQFKYG